MQNSKHVFRCSFSTLLYARAIVLTPAAKNACTWTNTITLEIPKLITSTLCCCIKYTNFCVRSLETSRLMKWNNLLYSLTLNIPLCALTLFQGHVELLTDMYTYQCITFFSNLLQSSFINCCHICSISRIYRLACSQYSMPRITWRWC